MIPISTTTIRVLRVEPDSGVDPALVDPTDEQPEPTVVAEGIRANISSPSGRERLTGGAQETVEFSLSCDPVTLTHLDTVVDEQTGEQYEVTWARQRVGFGLDHTRAGLKQVQGLTA